MMRRGRTVRAGANWLVLLILFYANSRKSAQTGPQGQRILGNYIVGKDKP